MNRLKFSEMSQEDQAERVKILNESPNGSDAFTICECGNKMVVRTSSINGRKFFGCSNFPKCKEKIWQTKIVTHSTMPNFANRMCGAVREYGSSSEYDYTEQSISEIEELLPMPTTLIH